MKKYRLLKHIEKDNMKIGEIFEAGDEMTLDGGGRLDTNFLVDEGFIEEVKEGISMLEEPDINAIESLVKDYVEYNQSSNYHEDNDYKDYVFETVLIAFYGKDIFKKIN